MHRGNCGVHGSAGGSHITGSWGQKGLKREERALGSVHLRRRAGAAAGSSCVSASQCRKGIVLAAPSGTRSLSGGKQGSKAPDGAGGRRGPAREGQTQTARSRQVKLAQIAPDPDRRQIGKITARSPKITRSGSELDEGLGGVPDRRQVGQAREFDHARRPAHRDDGLGAGRQRVVAQHRLVDVAAAEGPAVRHIPVDGECVLCV